MQNYFKFGQVIQEEMPFKKFMHNGRRPITIAHLEPLAQVS